MSEVRKSFVLVLMTGLALSGCTKKEEQPMIPAENHFPSRSMIVINSLCILTNYIGLLPFAATLVGDSRRLLQQISREIVAGLKREFRFRR